MLQWLYKDEKGDEQRSVWRLLSVDNGSQGDGSCRVLAEAWKRERFISVF